MEASSQETLIKQKNKNEKLACGWALIFVTVIGLIPGISYFAFKWLPQDRPITADPEEFIGSRARYYLKELTNIGPRVTGSTANEVTTINFLLKEIDAIILESTGLYTIESDVQTVSGKLIFYGELYVYQSVQNVVVKITPKNSNHTNALLINSHFDSVTTSPGAGDDGSMVAIMLGVLNSLTKSKNLVEHPIIFLFNGAEEKGLLAAHGFITQHKWAKDIKSVINLDAGGIGGKEILIQSGPKNNRLLDYYNKAARHPHGLVLTEEIFELPSFPADTDFTVFRDYGNLTGLNMVFISNGFFYHTYMDRYSNLDDGSLQHAGDNLLALARTLANSEELDEQYIPEQTGRGVYFDILGLVFVNYSENMGMVINYGVSILSLVVVEASIWIISRNAETTFFRVAAQFSLIFIIQLGSVVLGGASVLGLTYLLDYIGYTLSWLSQQWLMYGLYCCPFIFISGIIPAAFLECNYFKRLPLRFNVILIQHAQCLILAALTSYLTYLQYRSTFLGSYTVLFYILASLINFFPGLQKSEHMWLLPIMICQTIPLLLNSYILHIMFAFGLPITARMQGNPDFYLAVLLLAGSLLIAGLNIPIINMFRSSKSILSVFLMVFLVDIILVFTPIGFPYNELLPQRQVIFHAERATYDINGQMTRFDPVFTGYLIDRRVEATLKDVANKNSMKYYSRENDGDVIGFPNAYFGIIEGYNLFIPNQSKLTLLSKEELPSESGIYRYEFQIYGGAKTSRLTIASQGNNSLVDWSFSLDNKPLERKTLNATIQYGKYSGPLDFWVMVKKNDVLPGTFTITLNSEYLDNQNEFSGGLNRFLELFPKWTVQSGHIISIDFFEY